MSPLAMLTATVLLAGQAEQFVFYESAAPDRQLVATQLTDVDADFDYQGEYLGEVRAVDGTPVVFGLQVTALGSGQFVSRGYQDGLPGNGWDGETTIAWSGRRQGKLLTFDGPRGRILIEGGAGLVIDSAGSAVGQVIKIRRVSTTMGAIPPPGANVLFDGTSTNAFEDAKRTAEGWLDVGALTKTKVDDFRLHLEFRLPYMPYARSQGRANSGVYIQRRYEVQILDSFGLEPVFNGCAALYRQRIPNLNMSFPPLTWQTYDIFFTAARWDNEGNKIADARITVYHNGVAVHQDQVVPTKTGAGQSEGPEPGPILLQNHHNPVRFRNVWLLVGKAATPITDTDNANVLSPAETLPDAVESSEPWPAQHDITPALETEYGTGSYQHAVDTCPANGSGWGNSSSDYSSSDYGSSGYGGWYLWRGRYPN